MFILIESKRRISMVQRYSCAWEIKTSVCHCEFGYLAFLGGERLVLNADTNAHITVLLSSWSTLHQLPLKVCLQLLIDICCTVQPTTWTQVDRSLSSATSCASHAAIFFKQLEWPENQVGCVHAHNGAKMPLFLTAPSRAPRCRFRPHLTLHLHSVDNKGHVEDQHQKGVEGDHQHNHPFSHLLANFCTCLCEIAPSHHCSLWITPLMSVLVEQT